MQHEVLMPVRQAEVPAGEDHLRGVFADDFAQKVGQLGRAERRRLAKQLGPSRRQTKAEARRRFRERRAVERRAGVS